MDKTIKNIKTVVFLENANRYFKGISSKDIHPFQHDGYWTLSTPRTSIGNIRLLDPVTVRIYPDNHSSRPREFYFEQISDYLFIKPV